MLCSAATGFLVYFLFNLSREPFAILTEHQAILDSTLIRLQDLEVPPKHALPRIAVAIREALVESHESGSLACFLSINVHNETDVETNLTGYSLSVKIRQRV